VSPLNRLEHRIEREETNLKFRGVVEREYCDIFQVALIPV